jgi:hypothetical protein
MANAAAAAAGGALACTKSTQRQDLLPLPATHTHT